MIEILVAGAASVLVVAAVRGMGRIEDKAAEIHERLDEVSKREPEDSFPDIVASMVSDVARLDRQTRALQSQLDRVPADIREAERRLRQALESAARRVSQDQFRTVMAKMSEIANDIDESEMLEFANATSEFADVEEAV